MEYMICALFGYLFGCISPSWLVSRIKATDIRQSGTGNLGTTNVFIHFGKVWGCLVMFCDIGKAFTAVRLCGWLFPNLPLAVVIAGTMAVMGHIFPFYTGFHGGKGIACFAGFILAVDAGYFLLLLAVGCVLALLFNYGCSISFSAALLFPVLYAGKTGSFAAFLILALCSLVIIYKHMDNIRKIKAGEEMQIRTFLQVYVFGKERKA